MQLKYLGLTSFFLYSLIFPLNSIAQDSNEELPYVRKTDSTFFILKSKLVEAKRESSSTKILLSYLNLGEFYHYSGVYSEAIDQYNKGLKLVESKERDTFYVIFKNNIGKVHFSLKKFDMAIKSFEEGINSANNLNYLRGQAVSKGLLGACFEKKAEYQKALKFQKESLILFEKLNDQNGLAAVNENIGSIYEDLDNYEQSHKYFLKSYNHFKNRNNKEEANVLNNLGDVFRKSGNLEEAFFFTEKALAIAQKIKDYHQLESAHKDLSKTYAKYGDYKKAHEYLLKSEEFNDELLKVQNTNQVNVLQTVYETNKKEAQIQLLKEQNKVSKANQKLLWITLFAVMVVLGFLYHYSSRKRKAERKIQGYKQRMLKAELDKKAIEEENLQDEIKLKTAALSRYSLHLSQKNKILFDLSKTLRNIASRKHMDTGHKIKELVKEIDFNLQQEKEWDEFTNFFKEIHPDFIKKLSALSQSNLSPAEMRLGMLLRLNLSSKEISSILRVTPDSVRVARYRLRKKLRIDQKKELVNFMVEL
ncbi:tetratricopeptide repeat protein [Croceitalea rosinachiae]|uniref:Tetratricopeptide repeat protein n=1 Tax=Croceitalea rosinachiae TaxID=3075596 RepID=A0ABU3A9M5_9FLAO|nr:tetratricopeptide repeat protein [Croceitalea sp. F388]MDT0606588.1 tetratricopeptide repeat protein [Croceitalea sp. F388]